MLSTLSNRRPTTRRQFQNCFDYRVSLVLLLLNDGAVSTSSPTSHAPATGNFEPVEHWKRWRRLSYFLVKPDDDDVDELLLMMTMMKDGDERDTERNNVVVGKGMQIDEWMNNNHHHRNVPLPWQGRGGALSSSSSYTTNPMRHQQVKLLDRRHNNGSSSVAVVDDDHTKNDDQGLDEYIERMIALVDDNEDDDEEEETATAGASKGTGKIQIDGIKSRGDSNDEEETKEDEERQAVEQDDDNEEEEEEEDDDDEEEGLGKEEEEQDDLSNSSTAVTGQAIRNGEQETPTVSTDNTTATAALENEQKEVRGQILRPTRPNFMYRFLLGQGRVGHVIILVCVMIVELLRTFLPPVEHFLSWLEERNRRREQIRYRLELEQRRRRQQQQKSSSLGRWQKQQKQSKEPSRRTLQKQADQRALSQLRQLGNVAMAKYRWVSDDFMKRHGLGPFAATTSTRTSPTEFIASTSTEDNVEPGLVVPQDATAVQKEMQGKKVKRNDNDDDEKDVDWIVKALTRTASFGREPHPPPSDRGSSGNRGVSIEFHLGSTNVYEAPTSPRRRRRRKPPAWIKSVLESSSSTTFTASSSSGATTAGRSSNRKGPPPPSRENGVLDRLRAASGVDSMSRSLLGAYPGDAVPTSEAASADGLLALATKYGYGDWSEDEAEDEEEEEDVEEPRKKPIGNNQRHDSAPQTKLRVEASTKRKSMRRKKRKAKIYKEPAIVDEITLEVDDVHQMDKENFEEEEKQGALSDKEEYTIKDQEKYSKVDEPAEESPSLKTAQVAALNANDARPRSLKKSKTIKRSELRRRKKDSLPAIPLGSSPLLHPTMSIEDKSDHSLPVDTDSMTSESNSKRWRSFTNDISSTRRSLLQGTSIRPPLAASATLARSGQEKFNEESLTSRRSAPLIRPAMDRLREKMKEIEQNEAIDGGRG